MSLLADLHSYFREKPENVATLALESVFRHEAVESSLRQYLRSSFAFDKEISLRAQECLGENGRPDLVGTNAEHGRVLFIEVKFWAALTEKQPLKYLEDLPGGGLLLFVCPDSRLEALWRELLERVTSIQCLSTLQSSAERVARLDNGRSLAIVSGPALLSHLREGLEGDHRSAALSDIEQLEALWEQYDRPTFGPASAHVLSDRDLARSIVSFSELPQKVSEALGSAVEKGKSQSNQTNCVYVEVKMESLRGWIIYSPRNWECHGLTPIWFETWRHCYKRDPGQWVAVEKAFKASVGRAKSLESKSGYKGAIAVPLKVKPDAYEGEVVEGITKQLKELADKVKRSLV